MSQENVDIAREFIEAYNRRDFDAAVAAFDPAVEWVLPEHQSMDSCCGPAEIILFWEGIDETFEDLRLLPQEYIDAGDRVATRLRHHGRGKGSGVEIDEELYHQVATFREGTIVRMEYFVEWSDALRRPDSRTSTGAKAQHPPGFARELQLAPSTPGDRDHAELGWRAGPGSE